MGKKGSRQIRLCKCGKPVKEQYDKTGRFRTYYKTCGDYACVYYQSKETRTKISNSLTGLNHPRAQPLYSTRIHPMRGTAGYRMIKVNPSGRWMYEHRYVMEQHLGRKLNSNEHVHHRDGNTLNNELDNLILLTHSEHSKTISALSQIKRDENGYLITSKSHKCPVCGLFHHPPKAE